MDQILQNPADNKWQRNFRNMPPGQRLPSTLTLFPSVNLSPRNHTKNYTTETKNEFHADGYDKEYHKHGTNEFGNKQFFDKTYANAKIRTNDMLIVRKHKHVKGQ